MFHFSFGEILLTLVTALIVFGPKQLIELSHHAGKLLSRFRNTTTELKQTLLESTEKSDTDKSKHDHRN